MDPSLDNAVVVCVVDTMNNEDVDARCAEVASLTINAFGNKNLLLL